MRSVNHKIHNTCMCIVQCYSLLHYDIVKPVVAAEVVVEVVIVVVVVVVVDDVDVDE